MDKCGNSSGIAHRRIHWSLYAHIHGQLEDFLLEYVSDSIFTGKVTN